MLTIEPISQSAIISQSIESQPTTSQENVDIFEVQISESDESTEEVNIPTEGDASIDNNKIVCFFCNRKKKQLR